MCGHFGQWTARLRGIIFETEAVRYSTIQIYMQYRIRILFFLIESVVTFFKRTNLKEKKKKERVKTRTFHFKFRRFDMLSVKKPSFWDETFTPVSILLVYIFTLFFFFEEWWWWWWRWWGLSRSEKFKMSGLFFGSSFTFPNGWPIVASVCRLKPNVMSAGI